jgi:hypothetical protein
MYGTLAVPGAKREKIFLLPFCFCYCVLVISMDVLAIAFMSSGERRGRGSPVTLSCRIFNVQRVIIVWPCLSSKRHARLVAIDTAYNYRWKPRRLPSWLSCLAAWHGAKLRSANLGPPAAYSQPRAPLASAPRGWKHAGFALSPRQSTSTYVLLPPSPTSCLRTCVTRQGTEYARD